MQQFPCKYPLGCPSFVEFDDVINLPVNVNTKLSLTATNDFDYELLPVDGNEGPLSGSLTLQQQAHAVHQSQTFSFALGAQASEKKVTAYLTCGLGHTEPYTVTIKK